MASACGSGRNAPCRRQGKVEVEPAGSGKTTSKCWRQLRRAVRCTGVRPGWPACQGSNDRERTAGRARWLRRRTAVPASAPEPKVRFGLAFLLDQHSTQDLAGRRFRDLIDHLDAAGLLVGGPTRPATIAMISSGVALAIVRVVRGVKRRCMSPSADVRAGRNALGNSLKCGNFGSPIAAVLSRRASQPYRGRCDDASKDNHHAQILIFQPARHGCRTGGQERAGLTPTAAAVGKRDLARQNQAGSR
jgi:hypothetical protein